jgi:hypothetical protein
MREMTRQIFDAVVKAEKKRLVAKLFAAPARKSADLGMDAGGARRYQDAVDVIRNAIGANPLVTLETLRTKLTEAGIRTREGKPLALTQVARLRLRAVE